MTWEDEDGDINRQLLKVKELFWVRNVFIAYVWVGWDD